jgi:DNA-directed RNA polymerase subunit RPC12/RpoP
MKSGHYPIRYGCGNCGQFFTKDIPVGEPAPQKVTCPHCHVYGASKTWEQVS